MRAQDFIVENADQAAVTALQKKHGWSTGTTGYGDLYFTWQGNTYVFYGERMRINWPNGESASIVWGRKPDWQGRNSEFSFAQAVQRKLLKFDLSIWQQLDRGQINDSQALQKFKAENERQAREALAQGVTEGKLSVDVPNEDWLQEKIDYAKSKGRNSFGVPYMGSTIAGVVGKPPRVRVMRLASLPGMRDEQMNVRKDDLKWLMDYMERTGKLPPMGSNPDQEYLPYIMVAYNGEAWVNEGNHRIMAAYRLNWQDMPIEIRYFDGGERIENGPMAPGKIGLA